MRRYVARCVLRNGTRCVLSVIAHKSCDAICIALDTFGDQLRACSARPG